MTEGDELLKAVNAGPPSPLRWLVNPFERLAGAKALLPGVVAVVVGLALSRWGVFFDAAFDVHVAPAVPTMPRAILEQIVAWPFVALLAWAAAAALGRRGRAIDFLAVVGIARLPLLLIGFVGGAMRGPILSDPADFATLSAAMLLVIVVTLPAIAWSFVLLFQGLRTASGAGGGRAWVLFGVVVVVGEIASKVLLALAG